MRCALPVAGPGTVERRHYWPALIAIAIASTIQDKPQKGKEFGVTGALALHQALELERIGVGM
jgi:hypothetical protein